MVKADVRRKDLQEYRLSHRGCQICKANDADTYPGADISVRHWGQLARLLWRLYLPFCLGIHARNFLRLGDLNSC